MEFTLSEEQAELASTVRALLDRHAGSRAVREAAETERGYDEELWRLLCEQIGVAALAVPEEYGGAGFSLFESLLVLEELGRSLAPSPLLSTLVTSEALLAGSDEDARARLLPRLAAGEIGAFADGPDARLVLDGDRATVLVVATERRAREAGSRHPRQDAGLFRRGAGRRRWTRRSGSQTSRSTSPAPPGSQRMPPERASGRRWSGPSGSPPSRPVPPPVPST